MTPEALKLRLAMTKEKEASDLDFMIAVATLDHLRRFRKEAAAPYGGKQLQHQMYAPIQKRRELSDEEKATFDEEEKKWIGKIFKSDEDSPAVSASSPTKNAILKGAIMALIGGLGGGAVGSKFGKTGLGAGVGAVSLGTIAALLGYHGQKAENKDLREAVRRLPEGATRRDMKSDPVYQADAGRRAMLAMAAAQGGGTGIGIGGMSGMFG